MRRSEQRHRTIHDRYHLLTTTGRSTNDLQTSTRHIYHGTLVSWLQAVRDAAVPGVAHPCCEQAGMRDADYEGWPIGSADGEEGVVDSGAFALIFEHEYTDGG